MEVFNVRDFGAFGDGQTDDARAIQQTIDAASQASTEPHEKGGIVEFSPGRYLVSEELVIEAQSGLSLRGTGALQVDKVGLGHLGPRVSLVWSQASPPQDPCLLHVRGCSGMTIDGIGFYGDIEHGKRGSVTLLRFEDLGSHASLLNTLRNVSLISALRGVVVSAGSDMLFERVIIDDLETGFKTLDQTNANYLWSMLSAMNSTTVLDVESGGCINAHVVNTTRCGGTGADEWCFKFGAGAPGVRCSRIKCLRIEDNTKQVLRILGDHRVVLDSYTQASATLGNMHIDGGALTLHACCFRQIGVIEWAATSRKTSVRFRDCEFPTDDPLEMIVNPTTAGCYYSFERCDEEWLHIPVCDMLCPEQHRRT